MKRRFGTSVIFFFLSIVIVRIPHVVAAPAVIETDPAVTAVTQTLSADEQITNNAGTPVSFINTIVSTFFYFVRGSDGKPKTSFPKMEQEKQLMDGLLEKNVPGGGKMMPKVLQDRLSWPSEKPDYTPPREQYGKSPCTPTLEGITHQTSPNTDRSGAVSEPLPVSWERVVSASYLLGALVGTTNTQEKKGIPSVDLYARNPEYFTCDSQTNTCTLKPGAEAILPPCGAQSTGKSVGLNQVTVEGTGTVGVSGQGSRISATFSSILDFLGDCISHPLECINRLATISAPQTIGVINPLSKAYYCTTAGGCDQNIGSSPEAGKNLAAYKGWTRTLLPSTVIGKGVPTYDRANASTRVQTQTGIKASPLRTASGGNNLPHGGIYGAKRATTLGVCSTLPQQINDIRGDNCTPGQLPPTSNLAIGFDPNSGETTGSCGPGISARRPDARITNVYMRGIIQAAAATADIPTCVLEAVGFLEGAYDWCAQDNNPAQCVPNRCSAAGPFQITIGKDNTGNPSCSQCTYKGQVPTYIQENGCPNAWGSTSNTPCNIEQAASFAAQKLKRDPTRDNLPALTRSTSPVQQIQSILSSGYHYYGSRQPQASLVYNGKELSYGQFIVEHCKVSPH